MLNFMEEAIKQANKALEKDEVPIGAVIVKNGKIIARGYNCREKNQNALMHAEIVRGDWTAAKFMSRLSLARCVLVPLSTPELTNLFMAAKKKLRKKICVKKF